MIAVDAMGGDYAPKAVIQGAVAAARGGVPILLLGDEKTINDNLPVDWQSLPLTLDFCPDRILMSEDPGRAVRTKQNSSLVHGIKAVAHGQAAAFFSAGNSGAIMVASALFIGRVTEIFRPAVGTFLPTRKGTVFCLDVGVNVDCKAQYLYQFGVMGHVYLQTVYGIEQPRIGLLSNGHEPYKGPLEVKKTYEKLMNSPLNFIGNIEGREIGEDIVDVIVCDGFVGNVMLKTMQGVARTMFHWIKDEASYSVLRRWILWLNRGIFKALRTKVDYANVGGALLLGVNSPVIVAHGSSDARAIENGIKFAYRVVQEQQIKKFNDGLHTFFKSNQTLASVVRQKIKTLFEWK